MNFKNIAFLVFSALILTACTYPALPKGESLQDVKESTNSSMTNEQKESSPATQEQTDPLESLKETKAEESIAVEIKDYKFSPENFKVTPGAVITVVNKDSVKHSLTSDEGSVDTGLINKDATITVKAPAKPGLYSFRCTPHPWMRGGMVVE